MIGSRGRRVAAAFGAIAASLATAAVALQSCTSAAGAAAETFRAVERATVSAPRTTPAKPLSSEQMRALSDKYFAANRVTRRRGGRRFRGYALPPWLDREGRLLRQIRRPGR